jgi:damage-control phosphatase, subfamily I
MRTYLDCIPCFFRQALEAAKLAGASPRVQQKVLNQLARTIPSFSLEDSPPEMGRRIYRSVSKITGKKDPYLRIKMQSNQKALALYPRLKRQITRSRDPLGMATRLAIAGNIIDYGVKNSLNVEHALKKMLRIEDRTLERENKKNYRIGTFKKSLKKAATLLYLADNAGETVFDRLLIETIQKEAPGKQIFYAVKSGPAINDALEKDARDCGIDRIAAVITNGADAPGTIVNRCSPSFMNIFRTADMVISKGQGNFESLSQCERPVFFLFMAKCPVVAAHVRCRLGDIMLKPGGTPRKKPSAERTSNVS